MKKILSIGWKDLTILIRDRGALILMLGAPLVLALGLGLVTGAFSGSDNSGVSDIPFVFIDQDGGEISQALGATLNAGDLADLLEPVDAPSADEARRMVENDKVAAAIIVPPGFTASFLPDPASGQRGTAVAVELVTNPARPISAGVVNSILNGFLTQVETGTLAVEIALGAAAAQGAVAPTDGQALAALGQDLGAQLAIEGPVDSPIIINQGRTAGEEEGFNVMAYLAPGMAVLFLMYTVTQGGRSILSERDQGTLARLMISPTAVSQVLGGKTLGILFSAVAQMGILIAVCSLLFSLNWGGPLGVALLIIATAAAATGWGLLLASLADKPSQVSSVGTAMMLIFGIIGGSFFVLPGTGFMGWLSKITPNAWALQGFSILSAGGSTADLATTLLALCLMAAILFVVSIVIFRRRMTALF